MKLGFLNILTLIFIAAKLFGKITWSWWWVFSPTLFSIALSFLIVLLVATGFWKINNTTVRRWGL